MSTINMILLICTTGCAVIAILSQYYLGSGASGTKVQGTILGYSVEDYSSRVKPMVEFETDGQTVRTVATNIPDKGKPEIGSTVPLIYIKNEFSDGRVTYQVALASEDGKSQGHSLQGIAIAMWAVTLGLVVADLVVFFKGF